MSVVKVQVCQSNEPFHQMLVPSRSRKGMIHTVTVPFPDDPRGHWYCSCEGWKFRGKCEHCAMVHPCHWNSATGPEIQGDTQLKEHICPRCGGPTYDDLIEDDE